MYDSVFKNEYMVPNLNLPNQFDDSSLIKKNNNNISDDEFVLL